MSKLDVGNVHRDGAVRVPEGRSYTRQGRRWIYRLGAPNGNAIRTSFLPVRQRFSH